MGEISGALADFTIITSDNPRYEEPMGIIGQIEEGLRTKTRHYLMIEDRADAIKHALSIAVKGDIILIAGKGSEKYPNKTSKESSEIPVAKVEDSVKQNADLSDEDAVVAALVASIDYRNQDKKDIKVISIKEIK